jgi:hypothetical protein
MEDLLIRAKHLFVAAMTVCMGWLWSAFAAARRAISTSFLARVKSSG